MAEKLAATGPARPGAVRIAELFDAREKSAVCESILRALPEWFGIEESIVEYARDSAHMPFYAAFESAAFANAAFANAASADAAPAGFVALKEHNACTAELYVLGVRPQFHRRGLGSLLVDACVRRCLQSGREFLTVKTLDASRENAAYAKTRRFYAALGFRPLEVFPTLWGEENPCLFLARYLKK